MIAARLQSESFRAMGTLCVVSVATRRDSDARRALAAGRAEVIACEQALSRFDPTSDLSRLNASAGAWTPVGGRLLEALQAGLQAREETNGRFDPTILPALVAAGYDRSFERLAERPPRPTSGWLPGGSIEVNVSAASAHVEAGVLVDLGGIGKGYSATRAIAALRAAQPDVEGALVDLGGDIAIWGTPPGGGLWRISVADPRRHESVLGVLELAGGGVATSGPERRRFGPDRRLHHLIDPTSGTSAEGGPLAVTVVAADATSAEAHATALAVTPLADSAEYLRERPGLGAVLVGNAGRPLIAGAVRFTMDQPRLRVTIPGIAAGSGRT